MVSASGEKPNNSETRKQKTVNEKTESPIVPKITSFLRPENAPHTGSRKSLRVTSRNARRASLRTLECNIRGFLARAKENRRKARIQARKVKRQAAAAVEMVSLETRQEVSRVVYEGIATGQPA